MKRKETFCINVSLFVILGEEFLLKFVNETLQSKKCERESESFYIFLSFCMRLGI